ncbi:MAG: ornithine cyclodeaminase family protein [Verrucomicrobiota bacterium JB025]|nr:ornithine cyclodeaminase family protein [Verrucomicrobiota bacterium JB025]
MSIRLIARREISKLLPMAKAIELMREGVLGLAEGRFEQPVRQRVLTDKGDLLVKPARLPGEGLCMKLALTYPKNPSLGLPLVQGLVMVFDDDTGEPLAVMDAAELTAIRTGAGGGLAIELLARPESESVTLIGTGVQGRFQLLAAMETCAIRRVFLYDPNRESAEELKASLEGEADAPEVSILDSADEGVAQSDLVITATGSPVPTFSGSAVRPGTHINAIGAYQPDRREVDEETMRGAYVVVDGYDAAGLEAGELLMPGIEADADLAEVATGAKPGRSSNEQVTVFKSVGMAVQDAVAAVHVFQEAKRLNIGVEVDLF